MMPHVLVTDEELHNLFVVELGVVEAADFEKARILSARLRMPLERTLVEQGYVPHSFLLSQLGQSWGVGFTELTIGQVKPEALSSFKETVARSHMAVPFNREGNTVHVAMCAPRNRQAIQELERAAQAKVVPYLAPESAVRRALLLYKREVRAMLDRPAGEPTMVLAPSQQELDQERFAVELVHRLLLYAAVARASDIHIEPHALETIVRYRIDGVLREAITLPPALHPQVASRIKILSGMRIDERRVPQDGRFEADLDGFKIDLRVSTIATQWGEKVVMRVLSKDNVVLDLEDLGLGSADYDVVLRNILKPFGMILITGPTGSGKSTTLYAMLMRIGNERRNIINMSTIEDPIEYSIPRVNQMQVNHQAGMHFATGLRALLRQDPDVIMVGEIRDRETADIGIQAALVGRLLLSTLHANDSTGSVPRLLDMGVEPYLLASSLSVVIAQRLARRICKNCRESVVPDERMLNMIQSRPDFLETMKVFKAQGVLRKSHDTLAGIRFYRGKGCSQCQGSGFAGRVGIFELFEVTEGARDLIMQRKPGSAIRAMAVANGMKTMFQDGLAKAFLGETTLEEVFRASL